MLRTLFIGLLAAACGTAAAAGPQKFTVDGRIDGLQPGDTIRFETIQLPRWQYLPGFDIVVKRPGRFSYKGTLEHDQYYMMTYHPKTGKVRKNGRGGKPVIITPGDRITVAGTADEIYYSAWGGGVYSDPELAEVLRVEDSLEQVRGSYLRRYAELMEQKDTLAARECGKKFNLFYDDNRAAVDRVRTLNRNYRKNHPDGTLYLLVEEIPGLSYTPVDKARATFDTYSEALRESYFGQLYARYMEAMARLTVGQPGPDFTVTTVDGRTLTKADFRGKYLLMYHWGMCPGSIAIDRYVRELYDEYHAQGFEVMGLTQSIDVIRKVYESLPADRPTPASGTDDIRPVLARMVEHPWIEVELETDHPENQALTEAYVIQGLPFFVFLGPDGKILAREFHQAFQDAVRILNRELGGGKDE